MSSSDSTIEQLAKDQTAHYEPYGWHHWPAQPWMAYQFRRALGETQEGGGAVSECFQAARISDPASHTVSPTPTVIQMSQAIQGMEPGPSA